jgi:hypothetical protein
VTGTFNAPYDFGSGSVAPVGNRDGFIWSLVESGTPGTGKTTWLKTFGAANAYYDIWAVVRGLADGVVVAGDVYGVSSFDLGGGPLSSASSLGQPFVLALDAAGNHQWSAEPCVACGWGNWLYPPPTGLGLSATGEVFVIATDLKTYQDRLIRMDTAGKVVATIDVVGARAAAGITLWPSGEGPAPLLFAADMADVGLGLFDPTQDGELVLIRTDP